MARPKRGVAGERKLGNWREDAHPIVRLGVARGQHEGRLGQVRPARESLHLVGAQPLAVEDDGHRVAPVRVSVKTSI
jgi:hypothetical protein